MHLTPENAPVGAVVAVHNGMAEKVIKIRQWDEGHFRAIWPGGMRWSACDDFQFVRRVDQPEPVKASMAPTREDLRSGKIRWLWRMSSDVPFSTVTVGCHDSGTGWPYVLITRGDGCTWFVDVGNYEWGGPAEEPTTTPGDSVTIERDRAAMDALRRLAERVLERDIGGDVSMAELERIVGDAVTVRTQICTAALQYGWKAGGLREWIELELEELAAWRIAAKTPMSKLERLWRASERLPGEGDVVEWKRISIEHRDREVAIQVGPEWALVDPGPPSRIQSRWIQPLHPDLHPVRVDGAWRWVRKEKV